MDPQERIYPGRPGMKIELNWFFRERQYSGHNSCFLKYFNCNGSDTYDGTIFRFPLRTKESDSQIKPDGLYDTGRVMKTLFEPLKVEAAKILLFLKRVKSIKLFEKKGKLYTCIFSVEIPGNYLPGVELCYQQLSGHVTEKFFHNNIKVTINVYPISTCQQNKVMLVLNMIGFPLFPSNLKEFYDDKNLDYLPWIGIAMETGIVGNDLKKSLKLSFHYDWNGTDILSFIDKILSQLTFRFKVPNEYTLAVNSGKLFCFLPTPELSHLPVSFHGYFALSNDRRRIKWPTLDSDDTDSNWNRLLIEQIGVNAYAIFYRILIHCFQHETPEVYHYRLLGEGNATPNSLPNILVNQGLEKLANAKIVYSTVLNQWVRISEGLYHSIQYVNIKFTCSQTETAIENLLKCLKQPLVYLPNSILTILARIDSINSIIDRNRITPNVIRQLLRTNSIDNALMDYFHENLQKDTLVILSFILSDLHYPYTNANVYLRDVPLLISASCDISKFSGDINSPLYIYKLDLNFIHLFPGVEHSFVSTDIPVEIHSRLLSISQAQTGIFNIMDISNCLKTDMSLLTRLFQLSLMPTFHSIDKAISWSPKAPFNLDWIKLVWYFLGSDEKLIRSLGTLPLLPKENKRFVNNQLFPIVPSNTTNSYILCSAEKEYLALEKLLGTSGAIFIYPSHFIECLESLTIKQLPSGLLTLLEKNTTILAHFIHQLNFTKNKAIFNIIVDILNTHTQFVVRQKRNIILKLPIFTNMAGGNVSLSSPYVRVPAGIGLPTDVPYPTSFLSPDCNNLNTLYDKLEVPSQDIGSFVAQHLMTFMQSLSRNTNCVEHSLLSKWLLDNIDKLSSDAIRVLREFEWIVDNSNLSLSKCAEYRKAGELFYPDDPIMRQILPARSKFFPHREYSAYSHTPKGKQLFLSSSEIPNQHLLEEVIRSAVASFSLDKKDWEIRFSFFLKFLDSCLIDISTVSNSLLNSAIALPLSNRPEAYPRSLPFLGVRKLCKLKSVVFCTVEEVPLIASVRQCVPLFTSSYFPNPSTPFELILTQLNCHTSVTGEMLVEQLHKISETKTERSDSQRVHTLLNAIYASPQILSLKDYIVNDFVYVKSKNIFVAATQIVFNLNFSLEPYYYSFEKLNYSDKVWTLFLPCGACNAITSQQLNDILKSLYKDHLGVTSKQKDMVLNIINYLSEIELDLEIYYLLGADNILHLATECVFYSSGNGGNKTEVEKNSKIYFVVNSNISSSVATKFGAKSLKLTLLGNTSGIFECVGQYEHLTTRLKSILKDYESSIDVFKELIQNADDAKASTVSVLIDYCKFPAVSLIEPSMRHWQGPALYFYNDAEFTDIDFMNLMQIFGETKLHDKCKIGKFGLGFNTVYHLTDLPSFVSGKYIYMLDPHRKYLVDENLPPGIRVNFILNRESILQYRDQFNVFNLKLFNCDVFNKKTFKGTLFRLPFRSSDVSSLISFKEYDNSQIEQLKASIKEETESNILFLQHITSIRIYERTKDFKEVPLLFVSKKEETNPFPKHGTFISKNLKHFDRILLKSEVSPDSYHQLISITTGHTDKKKYFVSYSTGTKQCADFIRENTNRTISDYTPVASIALRESTALGNSPDSTGRYNMYCFLPLPTTSPFPMFINGCFALDQSRRGIACTEDDSERTRWNQALINDALVNALINLLTHLRGYFTWKTISQFYNLWPIQEQKSVVWKEFPYSFATRLMELNTPLFYSELISVEWVSYRDANFFLAEHYYSKNKLDDFFLFVRQLCLISAIYFIDLPNDVHSSKLFQEFFKDSTKIYSLERICCTFLFPHFHTLSIPDIKLVLTAMLPIVQITGQDWIKKLFSTTKCIPCGSKDNYALLLPSSVVSLHSYLAELYRPIDKRTLHPDLVELFAKKSVHYKAMKSLNMIESILPVEDVIDRCKCQEQFVNPERKDHCMIILKYLNNKCVKSSKHYQVGELNKLERELLNIDFIPVWRDHLLISLKLQSSVEFSSPNKCFPYAHRYIISPDYYAVIEEVDTTQLNTFLGLEHRNYSITIDMPISLLKSLKQNEKKIILLKLQTELSERAEDIYSKLFNLWCSYIQTGNLSVNDKLRDLQWIWHEDTKCFCHVSSVVSCLKYSCYKSKFLSTFPYKLTNNIQRKSEFLTELGINEDITSEIACDVLSQISSEHGSIIKSSETLLKDLIIAISNSFFNDIIRSYITTMPILLSSSLKLCQPSELKIDDMPWRKGKKESNSLGLGRSSSLVHSLIHPTAAFNLGASSVRSECFTREHFTQCHFGQHEDIADRITNLKRGFPCGTTILKELLQNAEDAGATEVAFVMDYRNYSSQTSSLCFSEMEQPNWHKYQLCPSLLVYNNSSFSEQDLEGIQLLGLGGKKDRHTIGKFGLGFNAVYHLTDSPCLLTRRNSDNLISFCIFDPFRKYLKLNPGDLPGMKLSFNSNKINEFPDQFSPYCLQSLNQSGLICFPPLTKGAYTIFRFPLMNPDEIRKVDEILSAFLLQSANINLFLENIKHISIYKLDKAGHTSILGTMDLSIRFLREANPFYPMDSLQSHYVKDVNISVREIAIEKNVTPQPSRTLGKRMRASPDKSTWLLFTHSGSTEGLEKCCSAIKEYKSTYEKEKLTHQVYGGIAVRIPSGTSTAPASGSCLYSYLPIGDDRTMSFPVVINAPFILEPERQHIRFKDIRGNNKWRKEWEDVWHSAIIEQVLTPLFVSLILYLRQRHAAVADFGSSDSYYYNWYYSLFPDMKLLVNSNEIYNNFLYALCEQFYSLLYKCNEGILINQTYKEWYCLQGSTEGAFPDTSDPKWEITTACSNSLSCVGSTRPTKFPKLSMQEDPLCSTLNKVQFRLTCAPDHVETSFKSFSFNLRRLDQNYLLAFLNDNRDKYSNKNISHSLLNMKDIEIMLTYLFNANTDVLNSYRTIPLKIDYKGRFCCFTKEECTFRAEYADLLPNCANRFILSSFPESCIAQLSTHKFIQNLDAEFLSSRLSCEVFNLLECCLFWQFILESHYQSHDLIEKFGQFALIPVKTQSTQCLTLISNLPAILNQRLSPISHQPQRYLLSSLVKLHCFQLSLNQFNTSEKLNVHSLGNYLKPLTIYTNITYLAFMSAVKLSSFNLDSVNFSPNEANALTDLFSSFDISQISMEEIQIISILKIFQSHQSKLCSVTEFRNCFINNSVINFGPLLIGFLSKKSVTIFCANPKQDALIQRITTVLSINMISERDIFLGYVIPCFVELDIKEQQGILNYIESSSKAYKQQFINQLTPVKFIRNPVSNIKLAVSEFYSPAVQLFTIFFSEHLLPSDWSDTDTKYYTVLCGVGLHNKADLESILRAAEIVENKIIVLSSDQSKVPLSALVYLINSGLVLSNTTNISLLKKLAIIRFLPVWKCVPNINRMQRHVSSFSEAELSKYNLTCCTASYVHDPLVSQINPNSFVSNLGIRYSPVNHTVIEHLEIICQNFPQLSRNHPNIIKNLFFKTYKFLQEQCNQRSVLEKFETMECILYNDKLFYPRNIVFSLDTILMDYLFKVPDALNEYHRFLKLIGVSDSPTYQHYAAVMGDISQDNSLKGERRKEISRSVFNLFIYSLRRAEELGTAIVLDIASTMVLSDQFNIVRLDQVVYIDNTRLKIRVVDFPDLSSLQFLLELPPNSLGSCEPPASLQVRHLSALIHESLDTALTNAPTVGRFQNESKELTQLLKSSEFAKGLIRIYYHSTKANGSGNLNHIRISSDNSVRDISKEPGIANDSQFLTIFLILQNLIVKVINSISLRITNGITGCVVNKDDIYSCFIENSVLYAKGGTTTNVNFFNDLTYALNLHLGNLFSDMLFALQLCLSSGDPAHITQKLDSFNIQACPFTDDIPLPQSISRPAAVLPATVTTRSAPSSSITRTSGVTRRRLLQIINTPPPFSPISVIHNPIATLSVQDKFIAKLWIRTAQCDLLAARKLIYEDNVFTIFPPHSCANCFECAMKTCIAILYINRFSEANISCQRNLDILLDTVKRFFPPNGTYESFSSNCVSLINFDESAKNPLMTPGIGCCLPMEQISVSTAKEAVASASNILKIVKSEFPAFNELMFGDDDKVWVRPTARSLMMTQLEHCKLYC